MKIENKQLAAALFYLNKCNFSVIPAKKDKKPYIQWQDFQEKKPTEDLIRKWWEGEYKFSNIAVITGQISNLTVIDIDTKDGKNKIEEILPENFLTPIVDTPSGGEHLYCRYQDGIGNAVRFMDGCDIRSNGGYVIAPPSSDHRGYWKWRNGCNIKETPPNAIPENLLNIIKSFFSNIGTNYNRGGVIGGGIEKGISQNITNITEYHKYFREGRRDNDLFHIASCLLKGGMQKEEIEYLLSLMALNLCIPPFPQKEISIKIKSAMKRLETRERNISQEVKDWVNVTEGHFFITECHKDLEFVTKHHKHAAQVAMNRLTNEGVLEKHGEKRGCYRLVDKESKEIKWWESTKDSLNLRWVFGFEKYIKTLPKSIYVIAGEQDAGKSALCLNLAILNCRQSDIQYFSSEMGEVELCERLQLYEGYDPDLYRKKIKFMDRSRNFHDAIEPNGINIIDYLEISENFYMIAQDFTKIRNKLDKGIAIIALQKKRGAELGRGAEFSLEKPRLYLSVSPNSGGGNILKVIKAKNWRNPEINPNGYIQKFKIRRGINLYPMGIWGPEYE